MGSQIETSDQSRKQRQGGLHRSAWPKNVLRGMLKNGDGIGAAILDGLEIKYLGLGKQHRAAAAALLMPTTTIRNGCCAYS